ncbi:MAG: phytanoyl-CoA dioxygenase family protein [candidate division Zixibacteria bacterium]|nr:phytanoyl-CoA dioxygenase family protein [candidate division Zixibacteria bacterium]
MPLALTQQEIDFFNENGYLLKEGFVSPDPLAEMDRETEDLHERMADGVPPDVQWEVFDNPALKPRIKQMMNADAVCPSLDRFVRADTTLDIVEDLLGPDISFFHCKLLMKSALNGTVTPWHQDYGYWSRSNNTPVYLNCMIYIDGATVENGCLQVVPGSHKLGLLTHEERKQAFGRFLPGYFQHRDDAIPLEGKGGTAIFFGPLIIHGSDANRSPQHRRACTTAYNVTGNGDRVYDRRLVMKRLRGRKEWEE